jgi:hypothetical protein
MVETDSTLPVIGRANFGLKPFDEGFILRQHVVFLDRVFFLLDQVVVDLIRRNTQLVGQVERNDLARQFGTGDRRIGAHRRHPP